MFKFTGALDDRYVVGHEFALGNKKGGKTVAVSLLDPRHLLHALSAYYLAKLVDERAVTHGLQGAVGESLVSEQRPESVWSRPAIELDNPL